MKSLAWLTDIHLNFPEPPELEALMASLAETQADVFLIGGDIGEAPDVAFHLRAIDLAVQRPIYFVLGNHDFYRGSIAGVRNKIRSLCLEFPNLHWLPDSRVVPLTEETCLVGHDSWGDGRLNDRLVFKCRFVAFNRKWNWPACKSPTEQKGMVKTTGWIEHRNV